MNTSTSAVPEAREQIFQYTDRLNTPLMIFPLDATPENGGIVPAHWHYYLEMLYMIKGHILATCDGHEYHLETGDLVLFHPGSVHSMQREPDHMQEHSRYIVLMLDLNCLYLNSLHRTHFYKAFPMAFENDPANAYYPRAELETTPIPQIIPGAMEDHRQKQMYGFDVLARSGMSMLLTHLIRLLQKRGLDTESVITAVNDRNMSVFRISEYIDQHCTQNLQVQELARLCGMSYSHFARLFRETYNQSCKEYIEFARMNKVEELLLFTNLDLNYIAQETGFSDCSHLIRTFRKWRGQTPKQWRKSQRM